MVHYIRTRRAIASLGKATFFMGSLSIDREAEVCVSFLDMALDIDIEVE
jgi:hypothetical protein